MATLVLVRHARTEQSGPADEGDHGRRLLPEGEEQAHAAGVWLAGRGVLPDLVLCSSAVRARATWRQLAVTPPLGSVEVWPDRRIYNAAPEQLVQVLQEAPDERSCVVLVGHAPGVPSLVATLTGEQLERCPTMTTVVLETEGPWEALGPGGARLLEVRLP